MQVSKKPAKKNHDKGSDFPDLLLLVFMICFKSIRLVDL